MIGGETLRDSISDTPLVTRAAKSMVEGETFAVTWPDGTGSLITFEMDLDGQANTRKHGHHLCRE